MDLPIVDLAQYPCQELLGLCWLPLEHSRQRSKTVGLNSSLQDFLHDTTDLLLAWVLWPGTFWEFHPDFPNVNEAGGLDKVGELWGDVCFTAKDMAGFYETFVVFGNRGIGLDGAVLGIGFGDVGFLELEDSTWCEITVRGIMLEDVSSNWKSEVSGLLIALLE